MKKGFLAIFKSELIRVLTSTRLLFLIIILPVVLFTFYASLFKKGVTELPVAVYDQDKTKTSRQLIRMLDATSSMDVISEVTNQLEGEKKIRTDEAMALIVIPKSFERDMFRGDQSQVVCYYNGQYIMAGGIINKSFQTTVGTFAAGAHMKTLMQKGLTQNQAMTNTSPVTVDSHILYNPLTNYSYYLNISLMPMSFQIIVMTVTIYVLGSVLKYRKGKELFIAGRGNILVSYGAKILPYTLIFSILGFFMNSLLYYKIGLPLKGSFLVVNLYFIVFVIICQLLALFIVANTSSLRTALSLGGSYVAISFSFAGYTFPEEGMPSFFHYFNYIFPYTSYLRFIVDYTVRGVDFNLIGMKYTVAMTAFAALGVFSMPAYNRLLRKGGYYV